MKKRKSIVSITNEKQLDRIKKPVISLRVKPAIKSLLALDPIKENVRFLIREGKIFEIYREGDRFNLKISDSERSYYSKEHEGKGLDMLEYGLDQMKYTHGDYSWMWMPPLIFAVGGAILGSIIGYYNEVWAEATYGAVEKAAIIEGAKFGAGGGLIGLIIDLVVGAAQSGKDFFEEPTRRVGLAKRVEEEYRNRG